MTNEFLSLSRRQAIALAGAAGATVLSPSFPAFAQAALLSRKIPSTGEMLPSVGIGTAIIFDFQDDKEKFDMRANVLKTLVAGGGKLVDTAPSYGQAEARLGDLFAATGLRDKIFLATKVRVNNAEATTAEMKSSFARLKVDKVDLMQLHNPGKPDQDLALLREWKKQGLCRYIGISSSFERDYAAVETIVKREKPDFFQIDYSMVNRNADERLIPAAQDAGCAVLTNLPFGRGRFFKATAGKPLPDIAKEIDATSWAQFGLKWLLGNPAVTAVIPGTDRPEYMTDNLKAGMGRLPDQAMRKRMVEIFEKL
ncbi:MAG: aldo/keto reductase [Beijerinckiaceae bacterium]|nr:aldo/keto reductase [Beijerinckiaceae bacterium]